MKIKALFLAAMALTLVACGEKSQPTPQPIPTPTPEDEYVTVSLKAVGEITSVVSEPIKAGESTDLIAIQVYKYENEYSSSYYAHGLFDDMSNAAIRLKKDDRYIFAVMFVKDGKNVLAESEWYGFCVSPFIDNNSQYSLKLNEYDYNKNTYFEMKWFIPAYLYWQLKDNAYRSAPCDALIGMSNERNPYTAIPNGSVSVDMKRVSFGLRLNIDWGDAPTNAKLKMSLGGSGDFAPIVNLEHNSTETTYESMYTHATIGAAWDNATYGEDNYYEIIQLTLSYYENDEIVSTPLSEMITFERNKITTINIKLSNTEQQNNDIQLNMDTDATEGQSFDLIFNTSK